MSNLWILKRLIYKKWNLYAKPVKYIFIEGYVMVINRKKMYGAALLFFFCTSSLFLAAGAPKRPAGKIGEELTAANALFSRKVYGKDVDGNEVERETVARTLLIFLDDGEDRQIIGAVTMQAMTALYQRAGPILVSGSVLHNIFRNDVHEKNTAVNDLVREVVNNFNPEEWLIKIPLPIEEWKYTLFLLIPKAYIWGRSVVLQMYEGRMKNLKLEAERRGKLSDFENLLKMQGFDLGKILGLKLENMATINDSKKEWSTRFSVPLEGYD